MNTFSFKGKSVLVTGGNRGIGAATVLLFAKLGADVAFNYRSHEDEAEALYQLLQSNGGRYFTAKCDVGSYDQAKNFVEKTIEKFSKIDILVNNAGIWEYGPLATMSLDQWHRMIQVNLDGAFYFTQLVVKHMKKNHIAGRIIHVSSTAAQRGEANYSHYAATKGAIISFTKSLAVELGRDHITVNCVAPGWVHTDMTETAIRTATQKIASGFPDGRIPVPGDIAGPIVFLASDWANSINGEILNVNAGSVLCG